EARVQIITPSDQRHRSTSRSLPVLLNLYAGPNSQLVKDESTIDIAEYLVSSRHYAVVKIDGRGSAGRGWKYRSAIYGALGTVEIQDQIEALKAVLKKHSVFDASRVSIFGWSYGGFAAVKAVELAPESFFKCTVSVAPVANFLYYDNVHFQHSALLMEALQLQDIDFDAMVYPNQDHSISRRTHLYNKMTAFLDNCAKH
ncbi:Venom dipeptidyl peptidase 4, partial [Trichostrongylus colubriformis]